MDEVDGDDDDGYELYKIVYFKVVLNFNNMYILKIVLKLKAV